MGPTGNRESKEGTKRGDWLGNRTGNQTGDQIREPKGRPKREPNRGPKREPMREPKGGSDRERWCVRDSPEPNLACKHGGIHDLWVHHGF